MQKRPSLRTGQPISIRSIALYHAAVVDLFKYAARRGWLPSRFNCPWPWQSGSGTLSVLTGCPRGWSAAAEMCRAARTCR
jgi:hypothetical protein